MPYTLGLPSRLPAAPEGTPPAHASAPQPLLHQKNRIKRPTAFFSIDCKTIRCVSCTSPAGTLMMFAMLSQYSRGGNGVNGNAGWTSGRKKRKNVVGLDCLSGWKTRFLKYL